MADTSLPISNTLIAGRTSGTFALTINASDLAQGVLVSAQSDGLNGTFVSLGASVDGNGWGPNQPGYSGDIDPGHLYFHPYNYGGPLLKSVTALEAGRDHSIVLTFSGTSASLYIDGKLDVTVAGNFSTPIFGNTVSAIGKWISPEAHFMMRDFSGVISKAQFFDHALTRAEALALSTSGVTDVPASYAETSDALGNHKITGSLGADALTGGAGADTILGGQGRDTLAGGDGADALDGGRGIDLLTGGAGADVFHFAVLSDTGLIASADHVTDFVKGSDKIDLHDAAALTFIGHAAFGGHAGEVRFQRLSHALQIDIDGDARADAVIVLDGVSAIGAGDLIL